MVPLVIFGLLVAAFLGGVIRQYDKSGRTPPWNLHWVRVWFGVMGAIVMFLLLISVVGLRSSVNDISNGNSPSAIKSRQDRAKQFFVTCAKDRSAVRPDAWFDFKNRACKGYRTLDEAYRTQNVPDPDKKGK